MKSSAFSLVELSIVLVILGLLVGGILAGQSLIRASELRAVTTEYQRYTTAIYAFRDQYFGLPGDISNATSIWTGTSNGNADGTIGDGTTEMFQFWLHLSKAGLIEGSYTGAINGGAWTHTPDINSPVSKLSTATWAAYTSTPSFSGNAYVYDGVLGSIFAYGGQRAGIPLGGILKSQELWNIDTKMDDGKPGSGVVTPYHVTSWNNAGGTLDRCTLSLSGADAAKDYDLDAPGLNCAILFKRAF